MVSHRRRRRLEEKGGGEKGSVELVTELGC